MEPAPEPINHETWHKTGWAGGNEDRKPGEETKYEDALGPEGFPSARETLFDGSKARDRTQGRRLRDDGGHDLNADAGNAGDAHNRDRIELLKQTPRTVAPEERKRVDIDDLKQEGAWIHHKVAQAALEITILQRDKQKMTDWLNEKGFLFDTTGLHTEATLQQMIHYWHLLPIEDQRQIAIVKPIFFLHAWDIDGDIKQLKGASGMALTPDEEVVNTFNMKGPSGLSEDGLKETNIDALLTKDKYDIAAAAIKQRWYLSGYAKKNEFDISDERKVWHVDESVANGKVTITANDFYTTALFAHELTHMRQDLANGVYPVEKEAADAQNHFGFYNTSASVNPTRVFRAGPLDPNDTPGWKRPLRTLARREQRLAFTSRPSDPADPSSRQIPRKIGSHDGETSIRQPLVQRCIAELKSSLKITGADVELDPRDILSRMHSRIKEVVAPLSGGDVTFKPPFYDPAWVESLRSLQDFIPRDCSTTFASTRTISGIAKTDFSPSVDLDNMGKDRDPFKSIIDTFEVIVNAQGATNDYSIAERQQLKDEARSLVKWGLRTVSKSLESAALRTKVAVQLQRDSSALFPDLLGNFSEYSNGFYRNAVQNTKDQLKDAVMKPDDPNNPVLCVASAEVLQTLNSLRARWSRAKPRPIDCTTAAGFDKIPDKDWYEIGAKMGFFNLYAREYDAEANGLAMTAPEEFLQMYGRWENLKKMKPEKKEQIFNQATYIFSRGIMEEGRLPTYKDVARVDVKPSNA